MFKFTRAVILTGTVLAAAPAFAVLPQQGMWQIGSEVNGKPGRGIQLDRQGGQYIIITYVGYRPDGSATFMQTSGKLTGGRLFDGELTEYKNGRALGDVARDGEIAQVIGPVSIAFDSTTTGTITLPGEAPQRFSRYQYEDHIKRLNNRFHYSSFRDNSQISFPATAHIKAADGTFTMTETFGPDGTCLYTGDLQPSGDAFTSRGTVTCTRAAEAYYPFINRDFDRYELVDAKVDEYGMFSARMYWGSTKDAGVPDYVYRVGRHFQGTCMSTGPVFADGSAYRCNPSELGLSNDDSRDWGPW